LGTMAHGCHGCDSSICLEPTPELWRRPSGQLSSNRSRISHSLRI